MSLIEESKAASRSSFLYFRHHILSYQFFIFFPGVFVFINFGRVRKLLILLKKKCLFFAFNISEGPFIILKWNFQIRQESQNLRLS